MHLGGWVGLTDSILNILNLKRQQDLQVENPVDTYKDVEPGEE